jgi:hypothetical protein
VIVWLFILAAAIVVAMVMFGSLDETAMPFACPACHHDSGQVPWYRSVDREGRVRCAKCSAVFKEHPNGALVRDPEA